jgi:hypothetical protein
MYEKRGSATASASNQKEEAMPSLLMSALSASAFLALTVLAPMAAEAPALQPLSMAKECSKFAGHFGDHCTITKSSLAAIPAGTRAIYHGPVLGPVFLSSSVVLDAGDGNTAFGHCNVDLSAPSPVGTCAFWSGSGSLTGFQAVVKLTTDTTGLFHWDGSYTFEAPTQ